MATTMSNTQWRNNISPEQILDINLFSPTFDFISFDQFDADELNTLKQELNEVLSSSTPPLISSEIEQSPSSSITFSSSESHPLGVFCAVCGAPAHGYNFDQITCESCKAFFRRNALRDVPNLKCRFSGACVINVRTRRQCTYCRLKKCFDVKMRKDWIRTDEEREIRQIQKYAKEQKKLNKLPEDQEALVHLPLVLRKKKRLIVKPIFAEVLFSCNRNLLEADQIILNNITHAYQSGTEKTVGLCAEDCVPPATLIEFINKESNMHESLIRFYKSIPHFQQLDMQDQIWLIKCNLVKIVHLHCILMQNFRESSVIGACMSRWINPDFHRQMSRARQYFDRFMEYPLVLKLSLVVFLFSMDSTVSFGNDRLENSTLRTTARQFQEFYITLLWRYLNHLFGEKEAVRSIATIITQTLHYQTLMNVMEEYIRRETMYYPCNQLAKSLFRLP